MKEQRTIYKCDHCGEAGLKATDFREVVGNIMVPDSGGLVGQNIFSEYYKDQDIRGKKSSQKIEMQRISNGEIPVVLGGGMVTVYSSLFCTSCFLKVTGFTEEGKNKY